MFEKDILGATHGDNHAQALQADIYMFTFQLAYFDNTEVSKHIQSSLIWHNLGTV